MIAVEGLSVIFGRTIALDRVDLKIAEGVTGLFGPNGSGKSTLLRALAGFQRPSEGRVTIDGSPVSLRDPGLRRRIGYVGHTSGLYERLTVAENVELFADLYGRPRTVVLEAIGSVEMEGHAGVRAGELSAGLKRRASVARALAGDPEILLLDEPYANLDDDAAAIVSAAIGRWIAPGRTAIVSTHGAKRVKAYADAGIILKHGRVAVAGRYASEEGEAP